MFYSYLVYLVFNFNLNTEGLSSLHGSTPVRGIATRGGTDPVPHGFLQPSPQS